MCHFWPCSRRKRRNHDHKRDCDSPFEVTFFSATHNATHAEKFNKVLIFLLFWSNLQIVLLYDLTTTTTADLSVQATVGLFQIISLTSQMNNFDTCFEYV